MKECKNSEGNWMWYVSKVKEQTPITDYKELLKMYMAGKSWQKAIEEMK